MPALIVVVVVVLVAVVLLVVVVAAVVVAVVVVLLVVVVVVVAPAAVVVAPVPQYLSTQVLQYCPTMMRHDARQVSSLHARSEAVMKQARCATS